MPLYSSKPFNPDIARVFYRAGYIESWGRGIQKICDACKDIGADGPEYIVHGEDIMVKFSALQSIKTPKGQSGPLDGPLEEPLGSLEEKLLRSIRTEPNCTYDTLAETFGVSRSTVKRGIKMLAERGRIERVGGKRYGHWKICE